MKKYYLVGFPSPHGDKFQHYSNGVYLTQNVSVPSRG